MEAQRAVAAGGPPARCAALSSGTTTELVGIGILRWTPGGRAQEDLTQLC